MSYGMKIARPSAIAAAALIIGLTTGDPVLAAGDGPSSDTPTCPRGEVYDPVNKRCVRQQSGVLPDAALTDYAYVLAKAERYDEALDVLNLLTSPNTAKALNYRGYATRKLGRVDEGIAFYRQSVALDPGYAHVREYLGEAYVIKGDIAAARAELEAIKGICGTSCEEYEDLAKAIAEHRG
jgi:tetratricopeptide (TPR) repeat protein